MEKDDYIWSRKLCFFAEENNSGEGTGGKYFEKKKYIFAEVNKKGEGKGGSFAEAGPSG